MFWKFDLNTTSHVDKLLDKEHVTLQELMDEDDILQECKAQNQKLLDFLCRQQCMEELVSLITQDPPLDMEEKVRFNVSSGNVLGKQKDPMIEMRVALQHAAALPAGLAPGLQNGPAREMCRV
ncbi:Serine/threonine-protein phosphatase 6 regulatory subunit 2 [Saguinus oedipus]|uniref:Serine/threonine-protein phosphatase 6 regulatory subunit 2 n=1 Tax=Saguinus oedipus TaxID=9490 RepID=A0ABQ9WLU9_SAGOE|nr:Serine/threonine-protein phosphatase 6 regulatory subunit 2 [Saguinus oedipus]